jgi:predicted dehydrogenase
MAVGEDLTEAQEMEEIAKNKGVRTMAGLQACQSPFVSKVKEIVGSGQIGKVLSTTFIGNSGFLASKNQNL